MLFMSKLENTAAWKELEKHFEEVKDHQMKDHFANELDRFSNFSVSFNDILLDYSKNRMSKKTLGLLIDLAKEQGLSTAISNMFSGVKINTDQNINNMISQYEKYADMISFTNMIPWQSSYDNPINEVKEPCTELWRRVFVWQDGKLNPCDYDYKSKLSKYKIGDISISELWNSKYYNDLRKKHLESLRKEVYPCNRCIAV